MPKHFVIVLIENHWWYEHAHTAQGGQIEKEFATVNQRRNLLDNNRTEEARMVSINDD